MKKLLLIAANFPYGHNGDNVFIRNEIDMLCDKFDEINILSTCKENEQTYFNEKIKKIERIDISKKKIGSLIKCIFKFLTPSTFKEIKYAKEKFKEAKLKTILISILKYYYCCQLISKKIVELSDKDTLVYSYWLSSRAYTIAKLKSKGKIAKAVSRAHRFDCYKDNGYLPFRREIGKGLNAIFFISQDGLDVYSKDFPEAVNFDSLELNVCRLGVDVPTEKNPQKKDKIFKIATCSAVIPVKRLDLIIDAISMLDFEVDWVHFGAGEKFDEITKYANAKLSNNSNIIYKFNGFTLNEDIKNYYLNKHIDLFINSSDSEGVPVSIMEAQSYGIATIARDVGGNREIILPELLLDKEANSENLAKKIKYYYNLSEEQKNILRENARQKIITFFDKTINAKTFANKLKNE